MLEAAPYVSWPHFFLARKSIFKSNLAFLWTLLLTNSALPSCQCPFPSRFYIPSGTNSCVWTPDWYTETRNLHFSSELWKKLNNFSNMLWSQALGPDSWKVSGGKDIYWRPIKGRKLFPEVCIIQSFLVTEWQFIANISGSRKVALFSREEGYGWKW